MIAIDLPLVSVGLPIYNRPDGLRRTLECFVNQTYTNIEIIIADNCSTDPEVEKVAREYLSKDSRIRYFRHDENKGWGFNTNFVIDKAQGHYFLRATDDDWWDISFVEEIMIKMIKDDKIALGLSNFIEVDVNGEKSNFHPDNHLPLLIDFANKDKFSNIKNYINQFEGFGKSNLYFSIFKTSLLKSDFVKKILRDEVLSGDLLINFYCLLRGDFVIVPKVLLKISFGNEKLYKLPEVENKVTDFMFFTIDTQKYLATKQKWKDYFRLLYALISNSNLSFKSKTILKIVVLRRVTLFNYDLICSNTNTRFFNIFYRLRRKHYLE
jgi:glycosyltransferase involved in cell wall biosynthesis